MFAHRATTFPEPASEQPPESEDAETSPEDKADDSGRLAGPWRCRTTSCSRPSAQRFPRTSCRNWPRGAPARAVAPAADRAAASAATAAAGPCPSRPGQLDGRSRIDIVATLRAAAPWQPLRRSDVALGASPAHPPIGHPPPRFEDRSDRLLIFAVDASGSPPWRAWPRPRARSNFSSPRPTRDATTSRSSPSAATGAELLLPPTRSLVQTKRRLAALPGGGGTPLAAGLRAAQDTAIHARRQRPDAFPRPADGRAGATSLSTAGPTGCRRPPMPQPSRACSGRSASPRW